LLKILPQVSLFSARKFPFSLIIFFLFTDSSYWIIRSITYRLHEWRSHSQVRLPNAAAVFFRLFCICLFFIKFWDRIRLITGFEPLGVNLCVKTTELLKFLIYTAGIVVLVIYGRVLVTKIGTKKQFGVRFLFFNRWSKLSSQ